MTDDTLHKALRNLTVATILNSVGVMGALVLAVIR